MHTQSTTERAALYVRVSSDKQEQDGTSLGTQEERSRAYAAERGYSVVSFVSDTWTGSQWRERPGLNALREQVRDGEIDVVIAFSVDRLSRQQHHIAILWDEITGHGARLEFVTETFEDTAVGRFILSARGFASEIEREKLIERTVRGRRARAQSGKLVPGQRPLYGCQWRDDTKAAYDIDPTTAWVVRRIFDEAFTGRPLRRIAIDLTDEGILTPAGRGTDWHPSTVAWILHHPFYGGEVAAWTSGGGEPIPMPAGTMPELVERPIWDAVQLRLARNKRESRRNNHDPEATLLRAGIARCAYCGWAMAVCRSAGRINYVCGQGSKHGNDCPAPAIKAADLDAGVWAKMEELVTDPDGMIERELARQSGNDTTGVDLAATDREIASIDRQQGNTARAIAKLDDDQLSAPLVAELRLLGKRKMALQAERDALAGAVDMLKAARASFASVQERYALAQANLGDLSYGSKRSLLDLLEAEVKVYKSGVEPRWVLKTILSSSGSTSGHNPVVLFWQSTHTGAPRA